MKYAEWIGWLSSVILLATLLRQVYTQWKTRQAAGVSRWLFVGQVTASIGFTVYSLLLGNWVYATSNVAILATAIAGEIILIRNKRSRETTDQKAEVSIQANPTFGSNDVASSRGG
jgi:MtN3 and saliva related transmembrane protein